MAEMGKEGGERRAGKEKTRWWRLRSSARKLGDGEEGSTGKEKVVKQERINRIGENTRREINAGDADSEARHATIYNPSFFQTTKRLEGY